VTVCGTLQFVGVKVSSAGATLPSSSLLLVMPIVTSAVGATWRPSKLCRQFWI
jgi:hypothetical protein